MQVPYLSKDRFLKLQTLESTGIICPFLHLPKISTHVFKIKEANSCETIVIKTLRATV